MNIQLLMTLLFVITTLLGSFLHFTHSIFKKGFVLHSISAVNESTWEHMKLAYMPIFFITLILYFLFKDQYTNVLESGFYTGVVSMLLIPIIYYPVRYILKKEIVWISISIFILSMLIGYTFNYLLINNGWSVIGESISLAMLIGIFVLFSIFTFYPPRIFLFKDPVTGSYGH